jgi:UDP-N-acetylglucosamine--N-acetylmuramyl-(pentapeptide) pyrophosphoryl-undecaprenol N-acetylglucosamine transferase
VFVQFDAAARVFARTTGGDRVRTPGIPLRKRLVETFGEDQPRRAPAPPFRLLVFGGSQGARQINDAMIEAVQSPDAADLTIFHQTGAADRERVANAYAKAGIAASVVDFEPDMPSRYRWADLALCRSGALTVAELTLAALPALFVPYPHAADDHQAANARASADAGAARVLDSRSLTGDRLAAALRDLFAAPGELQSMSEAAAKLARPDAAEQIIEDCAALLATSVRR